MNTRAFGRLHDQPVVATAHLDGVCWLWSAQTGEVVAGPFGAAQVEISLPPLQGKGGPQPSTDIAYRHAATDAVLARVHKGEVVAWNVPTGTRLAIADIRGSEATAVALGVINDQLVLARGASGGAISVWSAKTGQRLCGLTLDSGIRRLWFDHAKPTLMILTADGALHIADVVTRD